MKNLRDIKSYAELFSELGRTPFIMMPPRVIRVKIFKANWIEEIEKNINDWLKSNFSVIILNIKTHTTLFSEHSAANALHSEYIWTVIYQDYENND